MIDPTVFNPNAAAPPVGDAPLAAPDAAPGPQDGLSPQARHLMAVREMVLKDPMGLQKMAAILASKGTPPSIDLLMRAMGAPVGDGEAAPDDSAPITLADAFAGRPGEKPQPQTKPPERPQTKGNKIMDAREVKAGTMTAQEYQKKWGEAPPK